MPTISQAELISRLTSLHGATMVALIAETTPDLISPKKVEKEVGIIRKRSHINGVIGFIYGNSVNNQRAREADTSFEEFIPEPRKWGERLTGTPLVTHKGKTYVEVKIQKVSQTEYTLNGVVVDKYVVEPYIRQKREEGKRQEVENPVILRDYAIPTIRQVRMGGEILDIEE